MTAASERSVAHADRAFIGREKELTAFDDALGHARAGRGRIVMLAGPPGIGKTRTAQQVAEHATAHDMLVLWGRGAEEPGAPPYWPWLQVARQFVDAHDATPYRRRSAQRPSTWPRSTRRLRRG